MNLHPPGLVSPLTTWLSHIWYMPFLHAKHVPATVNRWATHGPRGMWVPTIVATMPSCSNSITDAPRGHPVSDRSDVTNDLVAWHNGTSIANVRLGTKTSNIRGIAHKPPPMMLCWANMSEKQTPQASTLTKTSPGLGSRSSASSMVRAAPCDWKDACLYVLGSAIVAEHWGACRWRLADSMSGR